jgi:hypothetical protein
MSREEMLNEAIEPFYAVQTGGAAQGVPVFVRRPLADAVADVTTADATDLASAITLVNVLKARVNELLAARREANEQQL